MRRGEWLKEQFQVDDLAVLELQGRMLKRYGYVPAFASTTIDLALAADQVGWLLQEFPGYQWKVEVSQHLLTCINESLAGNYGFHIHVKHLDNDGKMIRFMGAGLLERYAQPEKLKLDHLLTARRDGRGNLVRLT